MSKIPPASSSSLCIPILTVVVEFRLLRSQCIVIEVTSPISKVVSIAEPSEFHPVIIGLECNPKDCWIPIEELPKTKIDNTKMVKILNLIIC